MGIRGVVFFFALLVTPLYSSDTGVKNQSKVISEYLRSVLQQHKLIKSSGLLESINTVSERRYARYELSFDGYRVDLKYQPFDNEESYALSMLKNDLSAQDSKGRVVMTYSASEAHLFAFIDRTFREVREEEKTIDSLFDVMNWKLETTKGKTIIHAVANKDFPLLMLRMEFDDEKKLLLLALEMKNREIYALWSDK